MAKRKGTATAPRPASSGHGLKLRPVKTTRPPARVLYLYAISHVPDGVSAAVAAEAIDGSAKVEALRCHNYLCWISRVSKTDFADHLSEHMQDLEWVATAGLRHQRVVAEISSNTSALPARFGTVFLTDDSLALHVKERKRALRQAFERVAGADEWGIKIFALAKPRSPVATKAVSGADYLKRKAELLQPRAGQLDEEVRRFISDLTKLAVAASPGGKASAGQPGLLWHGSFLVPRKDRKKLDSALAKYAARWKDVRRVDCSGPWPPYSFVGEHVH
jgi:hypothetical protein